MGRSRSLGVRRGPNWGTYVLVSGRWQADDDGKLYGSSSDNENSSSDDNSISDDNENSSDAKKDAKKDTVSNSRLLKRSRKPANASTLTSATSRPFCPRSVSAALRRFARRALLQVFKEELCKKSSSLAHITPGNVAMSGGGDKGEGKEEKKLKKKVDKKMSGVDLNAENDVCGG